MKEKDRTKISKFLSLVLRHKPEAIGLQLDDNGWVDVQELIAKCDAAGQSFSREELDEVVVLNEKQRFAFDDTRTRMRASQGHSIGVELALETRQPPEMLFHGTVNRFLESIRAEGLRKMERQHVHLSADRTTAEKVGSRRGAAGILIVRSGEMDRDGLTFFLSDNGVWLTDAVPEKYIDFE
jgi:putative RNA 2'-phosphotransferase